MKAMPMKSWIGIPFAAALLVSACVTINVYFPAAEAREVAREFVEDVIADPANRPQADGDGGMALRTDRPRFDPWMLLGIAPAHAQSRPDITIQTPAIQALKAKMEGRFATLRPHYDSGAPGFTNDGLVVVRDAARPDLRPRASVHPAPFVADILDLSHDGRGVARRPAGHPAEGKTVFVTGALPGERVLARQVGRSRHFDEAQVVEVLDASPRRVPPKCVHFGT